MDEKVKGDRPSNCQGNSLPFSRRARKCKRFLYKGMRGNANNFVTAMSCMEACETGEGDWRVLGE